MLASFGEICFKLIVLVLSWDIGKAVNKINEN
jgi:hypothetical protein